MNSKFSIVRKGLLLVAIPLVIQACFIGMLVHSQVELDNAQRWAVHTKEVIARVEEVYRRLLEGYTSIRILAVVRQPLDRQAFPRCDSNKMPARFDELRALVSDNDQQTPRVQLAAGQAETFRRWLVEEERLLQSGERGRALDGLDTGARLLGKLREHRRPAGRGGTTRQ